MDTSTGVMAKDTSSRGARRMRTIEEKRRIVEETLNSQESVAIIARRHEVNANLVFAWRRLYERGVLESTASRAALVPVKVAAVQPGKRAYRRRTLSAGSDRPPSDDCVELELGAAKLRIRGTLAQQVLDRLLERCTR
jgi:transposase